MTTSQTVAAVTAHTRREKSEKDALVGGVDGKCRESPKPSVINNYGCVWPIDFGVLLPTPFSPVTGPPFFFVFFCYESGVEPLYVVACLFVCDSTR
jgi:hypothetical protein